MNYNKACIILEVTNEDTIETIRKKYLKLIAKYHPDINQSSDATEKAQEINQAYDYLKEHYETRSTENETKTYSSSSYYKTSSGTYAQNYSYQRQQYGGYYNGDNRYNQYDRAYYEFRTKYQNNETVKEYMRVFNVSLKQLYITHYISTMSDEQFLKYLKDEIEINKYCKILNKTKDSLFADYFKEQLYRKISFLDYLKEREEELEYLKKLDKTRESLYLDYTLYEKNEKTFLEYLKEQEKIQKYCDLLNRTLASLRYDFKYNQRKYKSFIEYLDYLVIIDKKCKILNKSEGELKFDYMMRSTREKSYTFSKYLDLRIEEENYCKILNDSRSNLKYEYHILNNYDITFIEFLKRKVELKNKTNEENADKKIMDNINKILKTNSLRSVSDQELSDILMVVFKDKRKKLFEILQDKNNMENLILLNLAIYKTTHNSECIRYANILGRDINELVDEFISINPSLSFKEYLKFKIVNEKRDQNFEEELKSKIKRK